MEALRILHTCESYPPYVCGVQEAVQRISEGLVSRGHDVTVATGWHPERDFDQLNGVKIRQFKVTGNWVRRYKGCRKEYVQFIRSFNSDVMMNYAAQVWTSDLLFPILGQLQCIKIFLPCGYSNLHNWKYWLYFKRMSFILRKYDHIIYHSDNYRDKRFGDKHGIKHYSVIGNGASDEEFLQTKSGFRSEYCVTTSRMFLCVSNYGLGKNQEMVLRAYEKAKMLDSALVFIGSAVNDYSSWLQSLVRDRDGTIRFLEHVPRKMVVAAYHEADLFLFGSLLECFPLVIVEAMASRTPFISTDVGCVAQLPGGIIVSSIEKMADAIQLLANKGLEWQQLAETGRRAWEEEYRWDRIVEQYESLYLRLYDQRSLKHFA